MRETQMWNKRKVRAALNRTVNSIICLPGRALPRSQNAPPPDPPGRPPNPARHTPRDRLSAHRQPWRARRVGRRAVFIGIACLCTARRP